MDERRREAFPTDPLMPGLAGAFDRATMCRLLAKYVWNRDGDDAVVEDCRVTRIRYRAQARCLVQYSVTVRHPRRAAVSRQLVTGTVYARPSRASRLARQAPDGIFIPDLQMLVSLFPSDYKLPQARVIMAGTDPSLLAVLRAACGDGSGPGWAIDSVSVEPVRYREHLALVARYRVGARSLDGRQTEERVFYVKAYAARKDARSTFDHLRALAAHAADTPGFVRVDAPVACLDDLAAVVLPRAEGRPLGDVLALGDVREASHAVRQAAGAVARFNTSEAPVRRRYSPAEYVQSLQRPLTILNWACPELGDELRQVAGASSPAGDADFRPTHRDMKPEHVLLDGGATTLIDLDSSAAADPVLDVALMLARFAGARGADDAANARLDALAGIFREEYFACVPDGWRRRLPALYASALIEVAAGLFHRQEPHWRDRVGALVGAAVAAADSCQ